MFDSHGTGECARSEKGNRGDGENKCSSRAAQASGAKRRKGDRGDGENRCSGRAPVQTSARRARRATEATGRTDVLVARRHRRAREEQEGQRRRRGEQMFESREGGSKQERRGVSERRARGASQRKRRRASAGAGAGVASSLQCRYYYDQQPGKSAANTGQNTRSVVVVAP
jgi:hypothetical protein